MCYHQYSLNLTKMSALKYHILWPGGNTTALVEEKFPRNEHVSVARKILAANKELEQVGFLEAPGNREAAVRLQMMGGEFCGNATRSIAYLWSMKTGLKSFKLEVSGFPELLTAEVVGNEVELQLPGSFFQRAHKNIVDLMGIRFIIQEFPKNPSKAQFLIEKYKENFPAVGVVHANFDDEKITIDPVVWVRETNTCYDETACGSGSIAASISASLKNPGKTVFAVMQPSKESYMIALESENGQISNIKFRGIVKYQGEQVIQLHHEKNSIHISA